VRESWYYPINSFPEFIILEDLFFLFLFLLLLFLICKKKEMRYEKYLEGLRKILENPNRIFQPAQDTLSIWTLKLKVKNNNNNKKTSKQ